LSLVEKKVVWIEVHEKLFLATAPRLSGKINKYSSIRIMICVPFTTQQTVNKLTFHSALLGVYENYDLQRANHSERNVMEKHHGRYKHIN